MEKLLPPEIWLYVLEFISSEKVHILPEYFPDICKLLTVEVDYRRDYVNEGQLRFLFDSFRKIRVLRCKTKTETSFECVKGCEILEIFWSDLTKIMGIFDRCPNLKELSLTGIGYNYLVHEEMLKNAKNLTRLSLCNFCGKLDLDFRDCVNLVSVDFDKCYMTDNILKNMCKNCPKLKEVRLAGGGNGVTDKGLSYLSSLTSFRLVHNSRATDMCVEHIAKSCPELETLEIFYPLFIREQSILKIIRNCPKLTKVYLNGIVSLSDNVVMELGPNITELDLSFTMVGNIGIEHIMNTCVNIESLSIRKQNIDLRLITQSRTLKHLVISFIPDISPNIAWQIIHMPLETIDVYGCSISLECAEILCQSKTLREIRIEHYLPYIKNLKKRFGSKIVV